MPTTLSTDLPEDRSSPESACFAHHHEAGAVVAATPEALFAWLDDQVRLAAHMSRPSLMMGGGRMTFAFDSQKGQAVGSRFTLSGTAFGLRLVVEEIVTDRTPPWRKIWRTVGEPRLVVIGSYAMGFEILAQNGDSRLLIWIDYDLPRRGWARYLPALAAFYAKWCVRQMIDDAIGRFGRTPV